MTVSVVRRVRSVPAPPIAPVVEVRAVVLTTAEERELLLRRRERQLHGEVIGLFKSVGAVT